MQRDTRIAGWRTSVSQLPIAAVLEASLDTQQGARLEVRSGETFPGVSLQIAHLTIAIIEPGSSAHVAIDEVIRDQCGELVLTLVDRTDVEHSRILAELLIPLRGSRSAQHLYDALLQDLDEVHAALAFDLAGSSGRRGGRSSTRILQPEDEYRRLEAHRTSLDVLLAEVATQPSTHLVQDTNLGRWRPGDRLDGRVLEHLARDPTIIWTGRMPANPGRLPLSHRRLSVDLEEHRHLRSGIEQLLARARALGSACERSATLIEWDRRRWGGHTQGATSVFQSRHGNRLDVLHRIKCDSERLAEHFHWYTTHFEFLREAGAPRTPLGTTPIFAGRPTYRRVFDELRKIWTDTGPRVEGDSIRLCLKDLDTLYEYWCFIRTVAAIRTMLGPPSGGTGFILHDNYFRPELVPGQSFSWNPVPGSWVHAWYEPDITPLEWRIAGPLGMRASLVDAPLRPDIVVALEGPTSPPIALALDAKNTARFTRSRLFEVSDYRSLVVLADSGHQPIRELFLLHRDAAMPRISNLPRYFEPNFRVPPQSSILGATLLVPGILDNLDFVLRAFLDRAGIPLSFEASLDEVDAA